MAGESAREQYERLRGVRQEQRRKGRYILIAMAVVSTVAGSVLFEVLLGVWWFGALVGLAWISKLFLPSQQEVAWRKGAEGEEAVGRVLDGLGPPSRALHDLRIPGSRANIDHVLIATTGVWTVDAKNYTGKIETRRRGTELWVQGRNRSKLLDQARRQTTVVSNALRSAGLGSTPVRPALCFLGVEWPLFFRPTSAGDVALVSPRRLSTLVDGEMQLSASQVQQATTVLREALGPAHRPPPAPKTTPARAPAKPPPVRPATSRAQPGTPQANAGRVTVQPWKRYGKNRLYVNESDGTTLGFVDLQTKEVVPTDEQHRQLVREAAAEYLRQG